MNFNWLINFLGSRNFDIWQYLHEELQLKFFLFEFTWLFISQEFTLCFISKFHRNYVVSNYPKYYDLSTGFCSERHCKVELKTIYLFYIKKIHDCIEVFNFEDSFSKMCKKFRNLSLFSVCLHFLTCKRSCEKKLTIVGIVLEWGIIIFLISLKI